MFSIEFDKFRRLLFHAKGKADWNNRDPWVRRAMYWKVLCQAQMFGPDEDTEKLIQSANAMDHHRSPTEKEIMDAARLADKKFREL